MFNLERAALMNKKYIAFRLLWTPDDMRRLTDEWTKFLKMKLNNLNGNILFALLRRSINKCITNVVNF